MHSSVSAPRPSLRFGAKSRCESRRDATHRGEHDFMTVRGVVFGALVAGSLWQGWSAWQLRAVHPGDGVIAPDDPLQTALEADSSDATSKIPYGHWTLTPRADYDITARILSREDYHFDNLAALIPEDLALGWGAMSDNQVLKSFEITQGGRFYFWMPIAPLPIPREDVIEHSANTHVIPADSVVRHQLARLRVGQVVHLTGLLVDGVRDDGWRVRTSLTRKDTGAGACEIMFVESVEVL
jgi:hypothetical protein